MFFDTPLASLCFNLPTLLTYLQKQTPLSPHPPRDLPPKCFSFPFLCRFSQAMILLFGNSGRCLGEGGGGRGNWVYIFKSDRSRSYKFNFINIYRLRLWTHPFWMTIHLPVTDDPPPRDYIGIHLPEELTTNPRPRQKRWMIHEKSNGDWPAENQKKTQSWKHKKKFEGMAGQRASWKRRYQKGRDFFRVSFLFLYYLGRAGGFFFVEGGEGVHKRGIFFIIYIKIGYPSYIKKQFRMIFPLFCLG